MKNLFCELLKDSPIYFEGKDDFDDIYFEGVGSFRWIIYKDEFMKSKFKTGLINTGFIEAPDTNENIKSANIGFLINKNNTLFRDLIWKKKGDFIKKVYLKEDYEILMNKKKLKKKEKERLDSLIEIKESRIGGYIFDLYEEYLCDKEHTNVFLVRNVPKDSQSIIFRSHLKYRPGTHDDKRLNGASFSFELSNDNYKKLHDILYSDDNLIGEINNSLIMNLCQAAFEVYLDKFQDNFELINGSQYNPERLLETYFYNDPVKLMKPIE